MPPARALRVFREPNRIKNHRSDVFRSTHSRRRMYLYSSLHTTEASQAAPAASGSPGLVQVSCLTRTDLLSSMALEALVVHKQTTMTNTMLLYNTKCQKPLSKSKGRQQNT